MLIPLHSSYLKKEQVYPHIINIYEEKSSKDFLYPFHLLIRKHNLTKIILIHNDSCKSLSFFFTLPKMMFIFDLIAASDRLRTVLYFDCAYRMTLVDTYNLFLNLYSKCFQQFLFLGPSFTA